ncbi:MAG: ATP-binding cassette domain-containing protein [Peptoniphilaceae bacterium]|nr:ATP-binding cassette domain-containing protein [Peptoniphilaceae bacterium]MDY6085729.1 ATP-binding cassette domain-containing protein [Peptoniphilaceae bacterium]
MIQIQHATKIINGQHVLDDINLDLPDGKIIGFQGRNGSGKTMLFRAITGLILLTEGKIWVNGKLVGEKYTPEHVGLLLENPRFIDNMSGRENLRLLSMMMEKSDPHEVDRVLNDVGLSAAADKKYRAYSLGMKQRLGIAGALLGSPTLILLDEPTIALDDDGIELLYEILKRLRAQGKTVLISSHEKEIIDRFSDIVVMMKTGKVVDVIKHESVSPSASRLSQ